MADLKDIVFSRATTEREAYQSMTKGYTMEEKKLQQQRFAAVFQIIEEAELADEYQDWKGRHCGKE